MARGLARVPERMCIVCKSMRPRNELFRLSEQDRKLLPNPDGTKSGKGYYICRTKACLDGLRQNKKVRKLLADRLPGGTFEWMEQELETAGETCRTDHKADAHGAAEE